MRHQPFFLPDLPVDPQTVVFFHIRNEASIIMPDPIRIFYGNAQHQLIILDVEPGVILRKLRLQVRIEIMMVEIYAALVECLVCSDGSKRLPSDLPF